MGSGRDDEMCRGRGDQRTAESWEDMMFEGNASEMNSATYCEATQSHLDDVLLNTTPSAHAAQPVQTR